MLDSPAPELDMNLLTESAANLVSRLLPREETSQLEKVILSSSDSELYPREVA